MTKPTNFLEAIEQWTDYCVKNQLISFEEWLESRPKVNTRKGVPSPTKTCEHCGVTMGVSQYKRWHNICPENVQNLRT